MIERHIALEGSSNFRDIGGYETEDGRQVRWGVIYRSGALSRLGDAGWKWMAERGIAAVCDLRSDQERLLAPTEWQGGERTRQVGTAYSADLIFGPLRKLRETENLNEMGMSLYPSFPGLLAPLFRGIFEALLDEHVPLIVHCSAGQDRTGLAIGLVLSALGVRRELIIHDYMLSTDLRRVENEVDRQALAHLADQNSVASYYADVLARRGETAFQPRPLLNRSGEPMLLDAFNHIDSAWGSIEAYLASELGVGSQQLERLRALYLEDVKLTEKGDEAQ